MPKGCSRIALIGVIAVLLLCGGVIALWLSPLGECYDFVSGHAPHAALEQFIHRVIKAAAAQDYGWLGTVSKPEAVEELKAADPIPAEGYTIRFVDDLAGLYDFEIEFDSGLSLFLNLYSQWPECPDRDVTEQEILQHIRLDHVHASRKAE